MIFNARSISLRRLFVYVCTIGILSFCFFLIRGSSLNDLTIPSSDLSFVDYFANITFVSNPAETYLLSNSPNPDVCLPPLAFTLYRLLWRLEPLNVGTHITLWPVYKSHGENLLIFVLYNMFIAIFLFDIVQRYLEKYRKEYSTLISLLFLISFPFLLTSLQRGNCVIIASLCIAYAFIFKDSTNKIERELALILIAIATGLKISPAFCGIVYLKEKRYKEAGRLICYGLILFFVPFIFFGGIESAKNFLYTLFRHTNYKENWSSIRGITDIFLTNLNFSNSVCAITSKCIQYLYLVISVICIFLSKKNWKTILLISGVLIIFLENNYQYNSCYLLPVALVFLREEGANSVTEKWTNCFYAIALAIIFSIPTYFHYLPGNTYMRLGGVYIVIYILLVFVIADTIAAYFCKNRCISCPI